MADHDEFDAALNGFFPEDIDWSAIQGMQDLPRHEETTHEQVQSDTSSDYFGENENIDHGFLDEVVRLERQALASESRLPETTRQLQGRDSEDLVSSEYQEVSEYSPALNSPSRYPQEKQVSIPQTTLKRRISSPHVSPNKRRQTLCAKERAAGLVNTFQKVLGCPICFEIIAAAHMLSCGHTACALCLCRWIATKKYNSNCPICRGHVNSAPKPNYLVDEMARIFFNQISDDEEEPNPTDRKDWEKRTAEGKAEYNRFIEGYSHSSRYRPAVPSSISNPRTTTATGFRPYQAPLNTLTNDYVVIPEMW